MSEASHMGMIDKPVFVGLSHIGQVFSIGWAMKFGACAVFDFHADDLRRFKQGILTDEEPDLAVTFNQHRGKIEIYDGPEAITHHSLVFLTMDTPLDLDGEPQVDQIFTFISQCKRYIRANATLIVPSQVYPGFCSKVIRDLFYDRQDIKLVYMVDTLKMGAALPGFLTPERLIFGVSRPEDLPQQFGSFGCKQYVFSHLEAEIVKISINLYLAFSVTFANAMDNYCRGFGVNFAPLSDCLRHDARIGPQAYISPSLGISGGHLERDLSTVIRSCRDGTTKELFQQIRKLDGQRMELVYAAFQRARHDRQVRSLLWLGVSYKKTSFSLVNSPFIKFMDRYRGDLILKAYDSYYALPEIEGVVRVADLEAEIGDIDCIIFNYANMEDIEKVEHALMSNAQLLVFDISLPPSLKVGQGRSFSSVDIRRVF